MEKTYDNYFKAAALLLIKYQVASTVLIQRKFRIGFNRAGRIFDQLEAQGIIEKSKYVGREPNKLLIKDEKSLESLLISKDLGYQEVESDSWNSDI